MEELLKESVNLQRNFRDQLDDSNHPTARELEKAIQRIVDDIELKKHPRNVEDQVKRVIQQLSSADGQGFIDNRHLDDLKDRFEDMRRNLQKLM